ncbi:MAG TPA: hypothetical protein VKT78_10695 [Fimbriimonadaceae bacterium]|nr:hypothetical protein [Fimbriimonadaceae bacterium]
MEQGYDRETETEALTSEVRGLVEPAPGRPTGMGQFETLAAAVHTALDRRLAAVPQAAHDALACCAGCSACCHRVVLATAPEIVAAASTVMRSFTPEARDALRERMLSYVAGVGPSQGVGLATLRPMCPFLVDGLCSIYAVRPIACRAQCSVDVAPCEAAAADGETAFPATEPEAALGSAALKGLTESLGSHELVPALMDFARAASLVLAAHEKRMAPDNAGEVFQLAAPAATKPPMPAETGPVRYPEYAPGEEAGGIVLSGDLTEARYRLFQECDVGAALAEAPQTHPAHVLFRGGLPEVYHDEADAEKSRTRFVEAFERFVEMPADPRQKFDAMSELALLPLSYFQNDDKELLSRIGDYLTHELTAKLFPDLAAPLAPRKGGRLKLGYIGDQLDQSSSGLWPTGWLRHHAHDVETFAFNLSREAHPGVTYYRQFVDHFHHLPGFVPDAARLIKAQDLDVLIYPDLASRGRTIQFATMRLARLQCAGWGGPQTTGMPEIDVFLSGELMEKPGSEAHYRERLVKLPGIGFCYPRETYGRVELTKADFGLNDGPLYVCAQTPPKLHPKWDPMLRDLTERSGRPIVFFRYGEGRPWWKLEERLKAAGVRTVFMPMLSPSYFRALLRLADVVVDSTGWSGGITALATIGCRAPVVTLPGELRRSRHTAAFLTAANAPGLIVGSPQEFVDLAANPERCREAARDMQPDAVFEDTSTVRALETFLREYGARSS